MVWHFLTVALLALSALPTGESPSFLDPLLEEHRRKILAGALGLPVVLLAVAWIGTPIREILGEVGKGEAHPVWSADSAVLAKKGCLS